MTERHEIWMHPHATAELSSAVGFYAQRASNLGTRLLDEFERGLGLIRVNPLIGAPTTSGLRLWPLRIFPYRIIYRIARNRVEIIAVAHSRRRPGYWRSRGPR